MTPRGLNLRQELPPPIPLSIIYSDQAHAIAKLAKKFYHKIQESNGRMFLKLQMVTAYKRNRNLQDLLVTTRLN